MRRMVCTLCFSSMFGVQHCGRCRLLRQTGMRTKPCILTTKIEWVHVRREQKAEQEKTAAQKEFSDSFNEMKERLAEAKRECIAW